MLGGMRAVAYTEALQTIILIIGSALVTYYGLIEIGGWENLSEREVASLYASLGGRKAKVRSVPAGILKLLAAAITPFHAGAGRLLRLSLQLEGREDLRFDASSMKRLAIDPVRLHEFALRTARHEQASPASLTVAPSDAPDISS